jgi:hypothetical protein
MGTVTVTVLLRRHCCGAASYKELNTVDSSVSDPDPVGSAFNLGLDPGSGYVFGTRIHMFKNRFKKPKFTMTDSILNPLRTRIEKCNSFLSLFKNLLLLAIFSYLALLKSYHIEWKLIFLTFDSALFKNIFENNLLLFSPAS